MLRNRSSAHLLLLFSLSLPPHRLGKTPEWISCSRFPDICRRGGGPLHAEWFMCRFRVRAVGIRLFSGRKMRAEAWNHWMGGRRGSGGWDIQRDEKMDGDEGWRRLFFAKTWVYAVSYSTLRVKWMDLRRSTLCTFTSFSHWAIISFFHLENIQFFFIIIFFYDKKEAGKRKTKIKSSSGRFVFFFVCAVASFFVFRGFCHLLLTTKHGFLSNSLGAAFGSI